MFDLLKLGKGYSMTFDSGRRVEVDFGPMSNSEKVNSSQKECDHAPASSDAEIRVFEPGDGSKPSFVRNNAKLEDLASILNDAASAPIRQR